VLDRTWAYLTGDSGAVALAHRHSGGHGLAAETVSVLSDWIAATLGRGAVLVSEKIEIELDVSAITDA
jgi:hypothetical protein